MINWKRNNGFNSFQTGIRAIFCPRLRAIVEGSQEALTPSPFTSAGTGGGGERGDPRLTAYVVNSDRLVRDFSQFLFLILFFPTISFPRFRAQA